MINKYKNLPKTTDIKVLRIGEDGRNGMYMNRFSKKTKCPTSVPL